MCNSKYFLKENPDMPYVFVVGVAGMNIGFMQGVNHEVHKYIFSKTLTSIHNFFKFLFMHIINTWTTIYKTTIPWGVRMY